MCLHTHHNCLSGCRSLNVWESLEHVKIFKPSGCQHYVCRCLDGLAVLTVYLDFYSTVCLALWVVGQSISFLTLQLGCLHIPCGCLDFLLGCLGRRSCQWRQLLHLTPKFFDLFTVSEILSLPQNETIFNEMHPLGLPISQFPLPGLGPPFYYLLFFCSVLIFCTPPDQIQNYVPMPGRDWWVTPRKVPS